MDALLLSELRSIVMDINTQINVVKKKAHDQGVGSATLQDPNGNYILAPLLAAKAQALHGQALLKSGT